MKESQPTTASPTPQFSYLMDAETSLGTAKTLFAAARLITLKSKELDEDEIQNLNSLLTIAFDVLEHGEEQARKRYFSPEKLAFARKQVRKFQKSQTENQVEFKIAA